jgi:acetyl esterase/lipase
MRLLQAGVACEFRIYPGAYHASEVFAPEAALSKRIWAGRVEALQRFIAS